MARLAQSRCRFPFEYRHKGRTRRKPDSPALGLAHRSARRCRSCRRKLARGQQPWPQRPNLGRHRLQIDAGAPRVGVQHDDVDAEGLMDESQRLLLVRVIRYQRHRRRSLVNRVPESKGREIDVGPLFLGPHDLDACGFALDRACATHPNDPRSEKNLMHGQVRDRLQSGPVPLLPCRQSWVVRTRVDASRVSFSRSSQR